MGREAKAWFVRHAGCSGPKVVPVPLNPLETAIIALGSNLGDPRSNVLRAFDQLQSFSTRPIRRSSLWETTPVDCPPGSPSFVNAVAALVPFPEDTPVTLLEKLQAVEREFGRRPKQVHNESRPLDLDIISFRSETRHDDLLTLPHPRAHERRFVLQPLAEIAPGFLLPGQKQTIGELLASLPEDPSMRRLSD